MDDSSGGDAAGSGLLLDPGCDAVSPAGGLLSPSDVIRAAAAAAIEAVEEEEEEGQLEEEEGQLGDGWVRHADAHAHEHACGHAGGADREEQTGEHNPPEHAHAAKKAQAAWALPALADYGSSGGGCSEAMQCPLNTH
jgi:hypothetical protein